MRPILYGAGETDFTTNGLGALGECTRCTVTQERTGVFELEMEYPVEGKRFADLQLRRIILALPDNLSRTQPFRIYEISKPLGGTVTVYARHLCYDLMGIPVSPFQSTTAAGAMVGLGANAAVDCPFTFWTDKTTAANMKVTVPNTIWELLGGSRGGILDVYGGEYEFDRYTVKLWKNRGYDRGVTIRYGKNLTSLKQEENCESVYTGVYPYWANQEGELVTLPEKIVNASGSFGFTRIKTKDFSQEWQEVPTEDQLRSRTETYIKDNRIGVPKVSLDVKYVQLEQTEEYKDLRLLEQVGLCDTVTVIFPRLGVSATAKCIAATFDVLRERYESLTLGDAKSSFASTLADQQREIAKLPTKSYMQAAIGQMTTSILGAQGGSVRLLDTNGDGEPDTLYIADSPDPALATRVWRFNHAGWGASQNGYNGPFIVGASLDKGLLADFITAGALKAGNVSISGALTTYDDSGSTISGYLGYMTGATESGTTSGIGVGNASGDCYAIATGSGIRLQAGDYSVYVTKTGVAKLTGKAGSVLITSSGDKGAGVYITGRLFRRGSEGDEWTNIT